MQAHFEGEGGPFSLLKAVTCPCWYVRSCLEMMWRPLWSRGPVWMALMPLPRQGQNTEFAWLWMCQKSSIIFCSGDPEASYKGRGGGDTDFRKNVSETWISWMWLYPWSVIVFMVKAVGEGNGLEGAEADSQDPRNQRGSFPLAVKLKAKSDSTTFLDIFTPLNMWV